MVLIINWETELYEKSTCDKNPSALPGRIFDQPHFLADVEQMRQVFNQADNRESICLLDTDYRTITSTGGEEGLFSVGSLADFADESQTMKSIRKSLRFYSSAAEIGRGLRDSCKNI